MEILEQQVCELEKELEQKLKLLDAKLGIEAKKPELVIPSLTLAKMTSSVSFFISIVSRSTISEG